MAHGLRRVAGALAMGIAAVASIATTPPHDTFDGGSFAVPDAGRRLRVDLVGDWAGPFESGVTPDLPSSEVRGTMTFGRELTGVMDTFADPHAQVRFVLYGRELAADELVFMTFSLGPWSSDGIEWNPKADAGPALDSGWQDAGLDAGAASEDAGSELDVGSTQSAGFAVVPGNGTTVELSLNVVPDLRSCIPGHFCSAPFRIALHGSLQTGIIPAGVSCGIWLQATFPADESGDYYDGVSVQRDP